MWAPELETLDQLLWGDLLLETIRGLYPDDGRFLKAVLGLLREEDVRLVSADGIEVPRWRWRDLFVEGAAMDQLGDLRLTITAKGAGRIA